MHRTTPTPPKDYLAKNVSTAELTAVPLYISEGCREVDSGSLEIKDIVMFSETYRRSSSKGRVKGIRKNSDH